MERVKSMKKKKVVALLCIGTLLAGMLAGCGSSSGKETENGNVKVSDSSSEVTDAIFTGELERNVTISVLDYESAITTGYFQQLIDAFNEKYAEYGITAVDANAAEELDLETDGPYGYGPDVVYQANDQIMKYAQGKHIYPIPVEQLDCYSQIPESAWKVYRANIDGETFECGVPVNIQGAMLFYRKDQLPENWEEEWDDNKNQIPDMVETWSEMYEYSKYVNAQDSSKYGYMKGQYETYFLSGFLFSYGGYVFGEDGTDGSDVGFAAGEAEKGANVLKQLASTMNVECLDYSIGSSIYDKIADGTYFATIAAPDTYSLFTEQMVEQYKNQGMTDEDAEAAAKENLVMTTLPELPASGDLTDTDDGVIDTKCMGGMNGYAISAYTESPNACLAFVDFATSYEMEMLRAETMGIAPVRTDAALDAGETSKILFDNMNKGNIVMMPSIDAVAQIWTPCETFFIDLGTDAFRDESEEKYPTIEDMKTRLEALSQEIYDAIHTLK